MNRKNNRMAPAVAGESHREPGIKRIPRMLLRILGRIAVRKKTPLSTADSLAVWSPEND
ncbi:MAG: hypothetical protein AB7F40_00190 [Victivallaceae bacterium]|nr:hypothetical protein [Victivallaceae bacterium]